MTTLRPSAITSQSGVPGESNAGPARPTRVTVSQAEPSILRFSVISLARRATKSPAVRKSISSLASNWDPERPWKSILDYTSMLWFHLSLVFFCAPLIPLSWVVILAQTVAGAAAARPLEALFRKTVGWIWFMWITANPQIRKVRDPRLYKEFEAIRESKKPVMILSNHVSFFDVILFAAYMPSDLIAKCISLCAIGIIRLPVIGNIVNACGHIPVNFSNAKVGACDTDDFSVDKSCSEQTTEAASEHIKKNGIFALYPEGKLNSIHERGLQPFRYGGFKIMEEFDMAVFGMAMVGNQTIWPAYDFGGLPGKVHITLFPIFPDGAKSALDAVEKCSKSSAGSDHSHSHSHNCKALANEARRVFQEELDDIWDALETQPKVTFRKSMQRLTEKKLSQKKEE